MRRHGILGWTAVGAMLLIVGLTAQQAPQRAETSLLRVRVLTPIQEVFKRFGNPTMVSSVFVQMREFEPGQTGQMGEQGGMFSPSGPGGDFGSGQARTETEMVYVYRVKSGSTYLFQVNRDGRVVQISAYGIKPDKNVRTSRGIGFGDNYSKVVTAYGYPDEHLMQGTRFAIRYNKLGVAFEFDSKTNKVVGIFVAAGLPNTGPGYTALSGAGDQQGQFWQGPAGPGGPPPGFFGGGPPPGPPVMGGPPPGSQGGGGGGGRGGRGGVAI